MILLLTLFISSLIARKKAKSNSDKTLAVSFYGISSDIDSKTKTPLEKYAEWLQKQTSL